MFAIIATGGKQYKVQAGDTIKVEKLKVSKGPVVFDQVLLIADDKGEPRIGNPFIAQAKVEATVLAERKAAKIRVIKYKAKTRYKRTVGHRQTQAHVKIEKITSV